MQIPGVLFCFFWCFFDPYINGINLNTVSCDCFFAQQYTSESPLLFQGAVIHLFSLLSNPYFTLQSERSFKGINSIICHSTAQNPCASNTLGIEPQVLIGLGVPTWPDPTSFPVLIWLPGLSSISLISTSSSLPSVLHTHLDPSCHFSFGYSCSSFWFLIRHHFFKWSVTSLPV